MGRRRVRPFLRKAGAHTYYLVGDFAGAEDGVNNRDDIDGEGVEYSRAEWEAAALGFYDQGSEYNYSQHLRVIGNTPGSVFIPAAKPAQPSKSSTGGEQVQLKSEGEEDGKDARDEGTEEEERQQLSPYELEKRAQQAEYDAELTRLRARDADLDEVMRLLEQDDEEAVRDSALADEAIFLEDQDIDLEDDFIQLAAGDARLASVARLKRDNYDCEQKKDSLDNEADDSLSYLDPEEAGRRARLLDEQFDQVLLDYGSDGEGALCDDEDANSAEGTDVGSDESDDESDGECVSAADESDDAPELNLVEQLGGDEGVKTLMLNCRKLRIDKDADDAQVLGLAEDEKVALRKRYQYESASEHEWDSDPVLLELEEEARRRADEEKWDCETVLTKNTNTENHPSVLGVPLPVTRARNASASRAALSAFEPSKATRPSGGTVVENAPPIASAVISRQRGENKEARKARKEAVKEHKRGRRAEKAETRAAFRAENVKQAAQASRVGRAKVVAQF